MQVRTRLTLVATTLLAGALLIALSHREGQAKDEDGIARAREAWNDTCQKCHTVPDATFETGRAFLAQITETS